MHFIHDTMLHRIEYLNVIVWYCNIRCCNVSSHLCHSLIFDMKSQIILHYLYFSLTHFSRTRCLLWFVSLVVRLVVHQGKYLCLKWKWTFSLMPVLILFSSPLLFSLIFVMSRCFSNQSKCMECAEHHSSNLMNLIINYSLSPPPSFSPLSFPLTVSLSFSLCLSISFSFFLYLSVTACQVAHQHRYLQVSLLGSPHLCQPRLCII